MQPLDVLALHDHDPNHLWQSYQEDMLHLVDKLAEGGRDLQTALHHKAASYVAEYGLDLRSLSTEGFLLLLAGDEDPKKPYQRVPLLQWLSRWVAQDKGKTLASALVRIPESGLPGPSPLSEKQWAGEIKTHRDALVFPGILSRLAFKEAHLRLGRTVNGPAGNLVWLEMLTAPELGGAHTNFLATLERCFVVPDTQAQCVAHTVRVMCQDSSVPDSASAVLTKATTTKALLGGRKSTWLSTPNSLQVIVRQNMLRIIEALEAQYGSTHAEVHRQETLKHLDKILVNAGHATSGSTVASTVISRQAAPIGAVDALLVSTDERTFRQALFECVPSSHTKAQLDALHAVHSAYSWFLSGGSSTPSPQL